MTEFTVIRAEIIRALDLIESQQITLFQQHAAPARDHWLTQLDALKGLDKEPLLRGMQQVLSDAFSYYNDPFANYISPAAYSRYQDRRKGGFVGVGLKYRARTDRYPLIIGPLLGGPMANMGIEPGDELVAADDMDFEGLRSSEISRALAGPPGSTVALQIRSLSSAEGSDIKRVSVQRREVELHYSRMQMLPDRIGYIHVSRFGTHTHVRVTEQVKSLMRQGSRALILDLRDNPGGSTRAARNIMSLFSAQPDVYCEHYKNGKIRRLPREGDVIFTQPLLLLINEHSKSSSEILAGALRDHGRAQLIGSPTYGKGLIQKVYPLNAVVGGAIRITIASYATPLGHQIHGQGLVPDVFVPNAPERLFREVGSLNISQRAREFRFNQQRESLAKRYSPDAVDALLKLPDTQLQTAVGLLKG